MPDSTRVLALHDLSSKKYKDLQRSKSFQRSAVTSHFSLLLPLGHILREQLL